jgi:hypothetical protein
MWSLLDGNLKSYRHTIYDVNYARKLFKHNGEEVCINEIYKSIKKKWNYWDMNDGNFPFIMRKYKKARFVCASYPGIIIEVDIVGDIIPYSAIDSDGYNTWAFKFKFNNIERL